MPLQLLCIAKPDPYPPPPLCCPDACHSALLLPQDDDIPGIVRYHTYEVLQKEVANPRVR